MRLIHIVTEVPWPADKGGKIAFHNHIMELASTAGVELELVMIDADGDREAQARHFSDLGIKTAVFGRALPHVGEGLPARIKGFLSFLFSDRPRVCRLRRNAEAIDYIRSLIEDGASAIILDQMSGWEIVPREVRSWFPVVYASQNVEQKVVYDQMLFQRWFSPLRFFFLFEYLKTRGYERRLLDSAGALICISTGDRDWYARRYPGRRILLSEEEIPRRQRAWTGSPGGRRLLFVGSPRYFPNLDALQWLAADLLPRLRSMDDRITLSVAGAAPGEPFGPGARQGGGLDLLGFVSDEELARLHLESDLYVCPITLGSGLKMKVLDALSWGMPVAATSESLAGIGMDGPQAVLDRSDPDGSAGRVFSLLEDRASLAESSRRTLASVEEYRRTRRTFGETVMEALHEIGRSG